MKINVKYVSFSILNDFMRKLFCTSKKSVISLVKNFIELSFRKTYTTTKIYLLKHAPKFNTASCF